MKFLFKNIARIGRFFINLLPLNYKLHHKFQNKYQITNTFIALESLNKKGFVPDIIVDIGCGYGEWFLKANKIFNNSKFYLFDADKTNEEKHVTKSFKPNQIFAYSDYLVDQFTSHLDREFKKQKAS